MEDMPQAPAENVDLAKKVSELEGRLVEQGKEASTKITELAQSKATLEKRLNEISTAEGKQKEILQTQEYQARMANALEKAKTDPSGAGQEIHQMLIETQQKTLQGILPNIDKAVKSMVHIERLRDKYPELAKHEELIFAKTKLLMDRDPNREFTATLDEVIEEIKTIQGKPTGTEPAAPTPQPNAGRGEGASNPPPPGPAAPVQELSREEMARQEAKEANARLQRRAMGKPR